MDAPDIIELLANLTAEDRRMVLNHFRDELRETLDEVRYLPGGGWSSGPMVNLDNERRYGSLES